MIRKPLPRRRGGFTLTEVLVVISIIAVIALLGFHLGSRALERARCAVDISKMRNINSAILARALENNGLAYTKDEVGNSCYRTWEDPLSLCQLLDDFLPGEQAWLSPSTSKRQRQNKNSYAWSRSANLTGKRLAQIDNPQNTITIWNSYCYTLPSVYNVPEGGTSGGPRVAGKQYHFRPWNRGTAVNWFYLDGHVETR